MWYVVAGIVCGNCTLWADGDGIQMNGLAACWLVYGMVVSFIFVEFNLVQ